MSLEASIQKLEDLHDQYDISAHKVSAASIGWHVDHCYRALIGIVKAMQKTDPKDYKWKFSPLKIVIMKSGWYPRGKVKAPKSVQSKETITLDSLKKLNNLAKQMQAEATKLEEDAFFKHPYFGDMKRDEALAFVDLHTHHHMKIVRDILKAQ